MDIKKEPVIKISLDILTDENIKVFGKESSLKRNVSTFHDDFHTQEKKSKVDIKKEMVNKKLLKFRIDLNPQRIFFTTVFYKNMRIMLVSSTQILQFLCCIMKYQTIKQKI